MNSVELAEEWQQLQAYGQLRLDALGLTIASSGRGGAGGAARPLPAGHRTPPAGRTLGDLAHARIHFRDALHLDTDLDIPDAAEMRSHLAELDRVQRPQPGTPRSPGPV
jgi:hypothetical protein